MTETNKKIIKLKKQGLTYAEIAQAINDEFGTELTKNAVNKRYLTHFVNIDNVTESLVKGEEEFADDFLNELNHELGGLFKVGILDIETTGLWADFGYVIVAVIKDMDTNKDEVFRLDECRSYNNEKLRSNPAFWRHVDKELLMKLREAYEKYDIIIHYNGRNFDIKFINTRMLKAGVPLLPDMKQLDIYQLAKYKLRIRSKRLDALKEFLEIDTEADGHKWEYWQMAGAGVKEGFDFVVEHCKRDVDRLTKVVRMMRPYINYIKK